MKIVPCHLNGEPINEEYTKCHRYFNGIELIIFDSYQEYVIYFGLDKQESEDEFIGEEPN